MTADDELDDAIGRWLQQREDRPDLLPGEFAAGLPAALRAAFLRELEELAELDRATSLAPPRDLPVRFGDFRVLDLLGQGAMGAVYLAEQVSLGRRVALKVLHPQVAGDLRSAARFQREARTAASLVHPGIVPVHGFGQEQGFTWLAMGLIRGRSLQRLLQAWPQPRDIDHARACALFDHPRLLALAFAGVADALEFAHRKNVVHRDVKPGNLMVGDDGRLVVLDFGLASARDDDTQPTLTRTGDFLGTPLYMAPEQLAGADHATARSDVYALGAVLYECLSGRPPVAAGSLPQVLDRIRDRDPDDPRRHRADVPAELAQVALTCLEKDPGRRYATAAALADDLRRFADGKPVHARGLTPWRRALRRAGRRPAWIGIPVLAVVALVLTVLWQRSSGESAALGRDAELVAIPASLAAAPEGITVFGGASRRWYALLGFGDHLPVAETGVSGAATAALQRAERLASRHPDDLEVRRTFARALLDVGNDPVRAIAVLDGIRAHAGATAADRAMHATALLQHGEVAKAERAWQDVPRDGGAELHFWRGIWQQTRQDYFAAIAEFDRSLATFELPEELRYFALLHRGWCKTCPEVDQRSSAENDLLQAAALRPRYGTARLLWAALRLLDPAGDPAIPVAAVGEVLAAVRMEPWVVTLVARVLLAFSDASALPGERLGIAAELSPIVAVPLPEPRRQALAAKADELLAGLIAAHPTLVEPRVHRVGSLTALGRHDDALRAVDDLELRVPRTDAALPRLLRARVLAAAGRLGLAERELEQALRADPRFVAGWRLRADLRARVGDLEGEATALERAVIAARDLQPTTSVLPDAAVAIPGLQLRRARVLLDLGRPRDCLQVLDEDFGGVLAGAEGPRIRCERLLLRARATGSSDDVAMATTAIEAVPAGSPLRQLSTWLAPGGAVPLDASTLASIRRGWLPATGALTAGGDDDLALLAAELREATRPDPVRVPRPDDPRLQSLIALMRAAVPASATDRQALLDLAERAGADTDHAEARLLKATLLLARDPAVAETFLTETAALHPDDLRGHWLLACAALLAGHEANARAALAPRNGRAVTPPLLPHVRVRTAVPMPDDLAARVAGLR